MKYILVFVPLINVRLLIRIHSQCEYQKMNIVFLMEHLGEFLIAIFIFSKDPGQRCPHLRMTVLLKCPPDPTRSKGAGLLGRVRSSSLDVQHRVDPAAGFNIANEGSPLAGLEARSGLPGWKSGWVGSPKGISGYPRSRVQPRCPFPGWGW